MGPKATPASDKRSKQPGQKSPPKPPLSVTDQLKRLFTSLCAQIDGGHAKNAIRTCDKILRLEPADKDATQTKLFLLLQTEQYPAALSLADSAEHAFEFGRAYSLYRLHREHEAAAVLAGIKSTAGSNRGVDHLEAQLNYRQGSYQTAFDLYNDLLDSAETQSDEQADILTNLEAAQKHLEFVNTSYLHALDALPASLINGLESNPPSTLSTAGSSNIPATDMTEGNVGLKPPVKSVRKKRVPKGVIPGVTPPPDPERWLKKSERANAFNQSGKKRKTGGGGATQGIVESTNLPSTQPGKTGGGGKGKKKK
ncbi:hypothetical protein BDM02DRAFT_3156737 [Thelephora ganbajun]|uniref:Uncharacterized protein n=1 Tax=Thelephora ganbajun TaxID=370292 RepID=A0ACB6Z8V4_THEGA|nr:hypothetical protein BDM02DRAFT_3156737 [Thelephora ganbajun]